MIIALFIIALLCLYKIQFSLSGKIKLTENNTTPASNIKNYLSLERTTSIKGIFILIVIIRHISKGLVLSDSILNSLYTIVDIKIISQSVVVMFLFYSGYGVMLSICRKGNEYVKSIPSKRVLKVLLHFDIAIILFLIVQTILGEHFSFSEILLSFFAWESLGNSNWYIFSILVLYLITYISFSIFKKNRIGALILTFIMTIVMISILYQLKEFYWYDTVIIYPIGMFYYLVHNKIEDAFDKKPVFYWLSLIIICVLFVVSLKKTEFFIVSEIKHILFACIVLLVTMKVQIHNKILYFCGTHLFSIFILHMLPKIILSYFGLDNYPILFVICCVAATMLLCVPFDYLMGKLDKLIFKNKKDIVK